MNLPIYLDNNATTPMDPRVLEMMIPYFTTKFGNAASRHHAFGWIAEEAVDRARTEVAKLIGASESEIIFTSGATEAANLAIKGVFETYGLKGRHIISCVTEHKAVLDSCKHLEKLGASTSYIPVDKDGLINLEELTDAITDQTILIAVMYGNNETGTLQPIREVSKIARQNGILFFSDATQAVGKIPVNVADDGIDLLAFSGHKMYGPKGVGALYVRRRNPRVRLSAQLDGGGHERGMRSGTLNVPGIAGLGKACELARLEMEAEGQRLYGLRNKLEAALLELEETYINGSQTHRLPHVSNIAFKYAESEALMMSMKDIAVSSGSACTSGSLEPSYVLKSLGLPDDLAHSSIRIALGRFTTSEEVDLAITRIKQAVKQVRDLSPQWQSSAQAN